MKEEATNAAPLPEGWRWVTLGEVCEQDREIVDPNSIEASLRAYLALENVESGSGKILALGEADKEENVKGITFAFDTRHVLYGKLRPYLNKVVLPHFVGRCTTELIPLLPKRGIHREYLAWVIRRDETVAEVMRESTGARMPRADMKVLFAVSFALPPLMMQMRIIVNLRRQFKAIEAARAAAEAQLTTLRALPAALLRTAFDPKWLKITPPPRTS